MKRKTLSGKILKWSISSVFVMIFVILLLNSYIIQQIIIKTANQNLNAVSELNASKMETELSKLLEAVTTVSSQLENINPYARGMASKAFVKTALDDNLEIQGAWIEWIKGETYGGLMPEDPEAKFFEVPSDYRGFEDLYAYRDNGQTFYTDLKESDYIEAAYFVEAMKQNKTYIMPPYYDEYAKKVICSAVSPIQNQKGEFIGCVGMDIQSDYFANVDIESGVFETSYSYLVSSNGIVITHSKDKGLLGKSISEIKESSSLIKIETPIIVGENSDPWVAVSVVETAEVHGMTIEALLYSDIISIVLQIILGLFLYFIIKKYLKPVKKLSDYASQIAGGDLGINVDVTTNDELGALADTFRDMTNTLKAYVGEISHVLSEISQKNLTVKIDQEFKGDFMDIESSLNRILFELNSTMTQIYSASEQVSVGADQVSHGAQELAHASAEQSGSVERLVESVSTVSELTANDCVNAQNAVAFAASATKSLSRGNEQMSHMLDAMTNINKKSEEISKIIKTIEDIAFQTNILALNAAVEAARAGSAGKGFAVVADEVRNLANKSAEAAKNTTKLIESSVSAAKSGMVIASETADTLKEITDSTNGTKLKVDAILSSTEKQDIAFAQMQSGVEQISATVQSNSATSEQSAAAAEELTSQAMLLKQLVGEFKTDSGELFQETH